MRDFIFDKDIIYVGGGNTRNLMVLWKEWGLDVILRDAYRAGKVMGGISAGSLCWYEEEPENQRQQMEEREGFEPSLRY